MGGRRRRRRRRQLCWRRRLLVLPELAYLLLTQLQCRLCRLKFGAHTLELILQIGRRRRRRHHRGGRGGGGAGGAQKA